MEERKEETKKGTEGRLVVGMAVAVLVVILCLMLDVRLGVGALVGIVAGSFLRPMLKDLFADEPQEEPEENRFLDTAVLRENFSIPQNLPIPYAVLDIRGRVMMYNEPFAAVFPNSEDAKPVIEVLRKTSGAGEPQRVTVGDRSYKAALNHCDVVDKSGAVGAVLTLIMVDITKTCQLEKELEEQETVVGMILLDNYDDVLDSIDENRLPILSAPSAWVSVLAAALWRMPWQTQKRLWTWLWGEAAIRCSSKTGKNTCSSVARAAKSTAMPVSVPVSKRTPLWSSWGMLLTFWSWGIRMPIWTA